MKLKAQNNSIINNNNKWKQELMANLKKPIFKQPLVKVIAMLKNKIFKSFGENPAFH